MKSTFLSLSTGFFILLSGIYLPDLSPAKKVSPLTEVKWYTWEEAMEANKKEPKKFFIDVYTDWCGWCKRMDQNTFAHPKVSRYLNENFYPIKFNAEQREDILYDGQTFKYVANAGRRGVHTLAYALLDGQMGYPTVVYLDENAARIMISPGYKDVDMIMNELRFAAEEHFKTTSWEKYNSGEQPTVNGKR